MPRLTSDSPGAVPAGASQTPLNLARSIRHFLLFNRLSPQPNYCGYFFLLTPYFLLLTSYSLLLTPYSLLLTPYFLLLTSYSLLLTPYFLLPHGTGSSPLPPQGWQEAKRFSVSHPPRKGPCFLIASTPYCEQVGV